MNDTTFRRRGALAVFAAALLAAACGGGDAPATTDEGGAGAPAMTAPAPTLEAATSLGVYNARMPLEGLLTAGQLTPEQFDALSQAGYQHFISLRLPDEEGAGWEEAHAAEAGIDFHRLPVAGASGLNRETVEALANLLEEAGEGTVLYCGSSNRVGALMALKAAWVDGASPEEALKLGRAAGMTRLEPAVTQLLSEQGG